MDEAQHLFGNDALFWSGIKSLLMGPQPCQRIPSLRIIVACSYTRSPTAFAGQPTATCKTPKFACFWIGATELWLLISSQHGFTGGWLLNWRSCCNVTLDSDISLERLRLSKPEYHELLSNFRMLECPDALFGKEARKALYLNTAGQVCPLLMHSITPRCPWNNKRALHGSSSRRPSCCLEAGSVKDPDQAHV